MNIADNITQFPKEAIERLPFPIDRKSIAAAIDTLVCVLDALDPDPDLEEGGDEEPSIGTNSSYGPDVEQDICDDEPALAAPETGEKTSQEIWSRGGHFEHDLEQGDDDEHSIGWPENAGQAEDEFLKTRKASAIPAHEGNFK